MPLSYSVLTGTLRMAFRRFLFFVFLFSICSAKAQLFVRDRSCYYYQNIVTSLSSAPYFSFLIKDSFLADSVHSSKAYFKSVSMVYSLNHLLHMTARDTHYWIMDSSEILYSGKYRALSIAKAKDTVLNRARFWQFKKIVGDTVLTDFESLGFNGEKVFFVIDSIRYEWILGQQREVYYLKSNFNQTGLLSMRFAFITGIGYNFDLLSGQLPALMENSLLLACDDQNLKYWKGGERYTSLKSQSCNYDSIAKEFSAFHTASVKSAEKKPTKVYPNPTKHTIHILFAEPVKAFFIYDSKGRLFHKSMSQCSPEENLDLNNFPAGVYSLYIVYEYRQEFRKFVICK